MLLTGRSLPSATFAQLLWLLFSLLPPLLASSPAGEPSLLCFLLRERATHRSFYVRLFYASTTIQHLNASFSYTKVFCKIFTPKYPFCGSLLVKPELSEGRGMHFQCILSSGYRIILDNLLGKYRRWER